MARRPVVLIHGYSANGAAFDAWIDVLQENGYNKDDIHVLTYESLSNEVTIDDIAEGFNEALEGQVGLDSGEEFDAIVHSTGMLVLRSWITRSVHRRGRLKHLIALAPATFGSPLAHKARGWLGSALKGNRIEGPDFREAGDLILDGLELGSQYTWALAHEDLLTETPVYGATAETPYVFTFCGVDKYDGIAKLVSEDGTDGTVRLAGCPLNTRKVELDLQQHLESDVIGARAVVARWSNSEIPLVPLRKQNHSTIMSNPSRELVGLVLSALAVSDPEAFGDWLQTAQAHARRVIELEPSLGLWQQLVFRVIDDRDDPVNDYLVEFITKDADGTWKPLAEAEDVRFAVHTYGRDPSLRCFHLRFKDTSFQERPVGLRIVAYSSTNLVGYRGYFQPSVQVAGEETDSPWSAAIDLTELSDPQGVQKVQLFYPFTTTLVEIKLTRVALLVGGINKLAHFVNAAERRALVEASKEAAEKRERDREHAAGSIRRDELMAKFEEANQKAKRT